MIRYFSIIILLMLIGLCGQGKPHADLESITALSDWSELDQHTIFSPSIADDSFEDTSSHSNHKHAALLSNNTAHNQELFRVNSLNFAYPKSYPRAPPYETGKHG